MNSFLASAVEAIHKEHPNKLENICLVLPNRRAKLFLKQYFHRTYKQTMWLPEMYSIEEFIQQLSNYTILDSVSQVFEFYHIYQNVVSSPDGFDEFCSWAPTLLQDFNEIDSYMIDHVDLFNFINETRALEVWNIEGSDITEHQKEYLAFWSSFLPLYENYTKHLKSKHQAYQGLAFRDVAENISTINFDRWEHIYFVGFNALNCAEENIIDFLYKENKCSIMWDADHYYLDNPIHEAGIFLRKFIHRWGDGSKWITQNLSRHKKNIKITAVPGDVNQVKLAANILAKQDNTSNYQDTAIVLADETLLLPTLESLPDELKHVNITMGYPLKSTPLQSLWNFWFQLHENGHKYSKTNNHPTFHHKDVLNILRHQSIRNKSTESIAQNIVKRNLVFIPFNLMIELIEEFTEDEIISTIFTNWHNNPTQGISNCLLLTSLLAKNLNKNQKLELEYLFSYEKIFNRLSELVSSYTFIAHVKTIKTLFNQIVGQECIPFFGEPLKGLQLMGMLETRTLDFKNVILISANEGTLPAGKTQNSFIPYDIKRQFKLPTHIEKDAIFAYHFYRILQRAENINLLYNANTEGLSTGEPSRFLTQLIHEVGDNIDLTSNQLSFNVPANLSLKTGFVSDTEIRKLLRKHATYGFSPSALNTFIRCPLDFYYKYILKLKEPDEVVETIESSILGSAVHDTLEVFYGPFVGKIVHPKDIQDLLPKVETVLTEQFHKENEHLIINQGKNLLIYNVAKKFVINFLQHEISKLEQIEKQGEYLTVLAIEDELEATFEHNGVSFKLKGKADRIDRIGNTVRIIDYKTGVVAKKDISVKDIHTLTLDSKHSKAFQLLTYALIYKKMNPNLSFQLESGNISFRSLSQWMMPVSFSKTTKLTPEILGDFEEEIYLLIGRIFDNQMYFTHNEESKYCNFCDI